MHSAKRSQSHNLLSWFQFSYQHYSPPTCSEATTSHHQLHCSTKDHGSGQPAYRGWSHYSTGGAHNIAVWPLLYSRNLSCSKNLHPLTRSFWGLSVIPPLPASLFHTHTHHALPKHLCWDMCPAVGISREYHDLWEVFRCVQPNFHCTALGTASSSCCWTQPLLRIYPLSPPEILAMEKYIEKA